MKNQITSTHLTGFVAATIGLVALTVTAFAAAHRPEAQTPQSVASTLDRVMQARFEANGGTFGEDRIVGPEGHIDVSLNDIMYEESAHEHKLLDPVRQSRFRVVLGIVHLRHKPGKFTATDPELLAEANTSLHTDKRFHPSADVIEATGGSDSEAKSVYTWWSGDVDSAKHLNDLVLPYIPRVARGEHISFRHKKYFVVIAPLKAERNRCLSCHAGAHRGDTLGAMIYMVTPTSNGQPASVLHNGI